MIKRVLQINKWDSFQHYKDRAPKWIKLYPEIIDEYDMDECVPKKFYKLKDDAKLTFVMLLCFASRSGGKVPYPSDKWLAEKLGISKVSVKPLIEAGYINCTDSVPEPYQDGTGRYESGPLEEDIRVKKKSKEEEKEMSQSYQIAWSVSECLARSIIGWKSDYRELQPNKYNKTIINWTEDIEKAIRIDNRDPEKMKQICEWLPQHEGNNGFNWRDQILSGRKLRDKYDKLDIAFNKHQEESRGGWHGIIPE